MTTALICIALLGLLVFGLGLGVSRARDRSETLIGHSDDPTDPLHKWVRAHGNTIEYAPFMALLFFVLGSRSPAAWVEWCMWGATASRYSLAIGLIVGSSLVKPNPLRFVGALGTYLGGFALCVALLLSL